jgi:protein SCO1/2
MGRLGIQVAVGGALLLGLMGFALMFAMGSMTGGSSTHGHANSSSAPEAPSGTLQAHVYQPPKEVADFTLTDQDGKPFRLSDTAGKVRVLYIGYTQCPDICPMTMVNWKNVKKDLGAQANDVSFVMITADPDHDTPDVMKAFVRAFDPAFIGLSGSKTELAPVWASFGAQIRRDELPGSATGYSVSHPSSLLVIAKDGRLALKIPYGETVPQIADDIRGLLQ